MVSPHCFIVGESRTDSARRRLSMHRNLDMRWCTPLYREANALTVVYRFFEFRCSVANALNLFYPSPPSVSHNGRNPETVSGRESASGFTRGLPSSDASRYVSLDNLIRSTLRHASSTRARIGPHMFNVIDAQQFYRRSSSGNRRRELST